MGSTQRQKELYNIVCIVVMFLCGQCTQRELSTIVCIVEMFLSGQYTEGAV